MEVRHWGPQDSSPPAAGTQSGPERPSPAEAALGKLSRWRALAEALGNPRRPRQGLGVKPGGSQKPKGARDVPEARRGPFDVRGVPGTSTRDPKGAGDAPGPLATRRCPPRARKPEDSGAPTTMVSLTSKLPRRSRGSTEARAATGRPPPQPAASIAAVARAGQPRPVLAAGRPRPRPAIGRAEAPKESRGRAQCPPPSGKWPPLASAHNWQRLRMAPMMRLMNSAGVASAVWTADGTCSHSQQTLGALS